MILFFFCSIRGYCFCKNHYQCQLDSFEFFVLLLLLRQTKNYRTRRMYNQYLVQDVYSELHIVRCDRGGDWWRIQTGFCMGVHIQLLLFFLRPLSFAVLCEERAILSSAYLHLYAHIVMPWFSSPHFYHHFIVFICSLKLFIVFGLLHAWERNQPKRWMAVGLVRSWRMLGIEEREESMEAKSLMTTRIRDFVFCQLWSWALQLMWLYWRIFRLCMSHFQYSWWPIPIALHPFHFLRVFE